MVKVTGSSNGQKEVVFVSANHPEEAFGKAKEIFVAKGMNEYDLEMTVDFADI